MNYRVNFKQAFCILSLLILSGCSYSHAPRYYKEIEPSDFKSKCSWALFGNEDDGIYGEDADFLPNDPNDDTKARKWWVRNPLHNFCFYVIGSADKVNDEITLFRASQNGLSAFTYKPVGDTVFADKASSLFLGLHGKKPFFSLRIGSRRRSFDFYLGWRERGNFGFKCCLRRKG